MEGLATPNPVICTFNTRPTTYVYTSVVWSSPNAGPIPQHRDMLPPSLWYPLKSALFVRLISPPQPSTLRVAAFGNPRLLRAVCTFVSSARLLDRNMKLAAGVIAASDRPKFNRADATLVNAVKLSPLSRNPDSGVIAVEVSSKFARAVALFGASDRLLPACNKALSGVVAVDVSPKFARARSEERRVGKEWR